MKILAIFDEFSDLSGPSLVYSSLIQRLTENCGIEVFCLIPNNPMLIKKLSYLGIDYKVENFLVTKPRERFLNHFIVNRNRSNKMRIISSNIEMYKPDIIHCTVHPLGTLLYDLGINTIPVIVHHHGTFRYPMINPYRYIYRKMYKVDSNFYPLTVSDWIRHNLISMGIDKGKITRIYNGINLDLFKFYNNKKIKKTKFTIGIVGDLRPEKGVDHFIKSMALVSKKMNFEFKAVILGRFSSPGYIKKCKELAELSSSRNLTFEFIGHTLNVVEFMKVFDLTVVPSLFNDPLPTVAIESLALGVPFVGYAVGGIPEIALNDQYLASPRSITKLAEKIEIILNAIINNEIDYLSLHKYAMEHFDVKNNSIHYMNYVNKIKADVN